jgi:hypothetical protein
MPWIRKVLTEPWVILSKVLRNSNFIAKEYLKKSNKKKRGDAWISWPVSMPVLSSIYICSKDIMVTRKYKMENKTRVWFVQKKGGRYIQCKIERRGIRSRRGHTLRALL